MLMKVYMSKFRYIDFPSKEIPYPLMKNQFHWLYQ